MRRGNVESRWIALFTVQIDMTVTVFADGRGEARGRGARRRVVNVPKEGDACQGVMLM